MMKIALLYTPPGTDAGMDDLDTLEQVTCIGNALKEMGVESREFPVPDNYSLFRESLRNNREELIFNLTDPLAGEGRLISLYPLALEQEGRAYTGCSADALYTTSNKTLAKKIMNLSGIPTAYSVTPGQNENMDSSIFQEGRFIIKSIWEHSSQGLSADSVFEAESFEQIKSRLEKSPAGFFAEAFLPGREINIGLLQNKDSWTILSPSEIVYSDHSDPAPFLDYKSKWDEDSLSYKNSSRTLDFIHADKPLLEKLESIALRCADVFSLRGYARVDFRMDRECRPMVMEVNANPCLSPNSGFVSSAQKSGIGFTQVIERIITASTGKWG